MKKFLVFVCILLIGTFLFGCGGKEKITSIEVYSDQVEFDKNFQLSDLSVKVSKTDGTSELIPLTEGMISAADLEKLSTVGTHTIGVSYQELTTSFTITIVGEKGEDGREIVLQVADGYIKWQYEGDTTWTNLISLDDIKGSNGIDGKKPLFQISNNYIQFQYEGDSSWNNLISLDLLKGEAGATPTVSISDDGYWVINGTKTDHKAEINPPTPELYTVTFDLNGGTMPEGYSEVLTVEKGNAIDLPLPTKDKYLFNGWFTGEEPNDGQFKITDTVSKNITLHAKWIADLSVLQDFFDIGLSKNYTANIMMINQENLNKLEMQGIFRISESNGSIYTHEIETDKYYQNNNEIINEQNTYEDYNMYLELYRYQLSKESYQDYWYFNKDEKIYEPDMIFDMFDINNFVKREDVNIYDYQVTDEFLDQIIFSKKMQYELEYYGEVYIDLDLMKLVIHLEVDDGEDYLTQDIELTFSNVGTTSVEIPIEIVKDAVLDRIDITVSSIPDVSFLTDDCNLQFTNRIDQIKLDINNGTSIASLFDMQTAYQNEISQYPVEIDYVKKIKFEVLEFIQNYIDEKTDLATNDSILAMQQTLNSYTLLINNSFNTFEIQGYQQQCLIEIENVYVTDPNKLALSLEKIKVRDTLQTIVSKGIELVIFYDDQQLILDIFNNYYDLINSALTSEEINSYFNAAINELISLDLIYDYYNLSYYRSEIITEINVAFADKNLSYIAEYYNIVNVYDNYQNLINQSNDPFELYQIHQNGLIDLKNIILEETYKNINSRMENDKNNYIMFIIDSEIESFNNLCLQYQNSIVNETNYQNIIAIYYNFTSQISSFTTDQLKMSKYYNVLGLQNFVDENLYYATADSKLAMNDLLTYYTGQVNNSLTVDDSNNNYYNGINAIKNAYENDYDFINLVKSTDLIRIKINYYTGVLYSFLSDSDEQEKINNLYDVYMPLLDNVNSLSEAETLYSEWYSKLLKLELHLSYSDFDLFKNDCLNILSQYYNSLPNTINYIPSSVSTEYTNSMNRIDNSYNFEEIMSSFFNTMMLFIDVVKNESLTQIQENYNYYHEVVDSNVINELDYLYKVTYKNISVSIEPNDIYWYIVDFNDFCDSLSIDSIKDQRYFIKSEFSNIFNNLTTTATDDCKVALQLVYDDFLVQINDINDYSLMIQLMNEFEYHLYSNIIIDETKLLEYKQKEKLIDLMESSTNYIGQFIVNYDEYDYLWDEFDRITPLIKNSTTLEEANSLYQEWYNLFLTLELDLTSFDKEQIYNDFYFSYTELIYYTNNSSIETIYNSYISMLNETNDFFEIENIANNFYYEIDKIYDIYDQQQYFNDIDETYFEYQILVIDEDLEELTQIYNTFTNWGFVQIDLDLYSIYQLYTEKLASLQIDTLKEAKNNAIDLLNEYFEERSINATDASITSMQNILVSNITIIWNATLIDDVNSQLEIAKNAINSAYVIDEEKVALLNYKNAINEEISVYTSNSIQFTYNEVYNLLNIKEKYVNLINNATTVTEIDNIYDTWYNEVTSLNIVYSSGLDDYKASQLIYLNSLYNDLLNNLYEVPETLLIDYQVYTDIISNANNPFVVQKTVRDCKNMFDNVRFNDMRNKTLLDLEDIYNQNTPLISSENLPIYQATYNQYISDINSATTYQQLCDALNAFSNYSVSFPKDPLIIVRKDLKQKISNYYEELSMFATVESSNSMLPILNNFNSSIDSLTNMDSLNALYAQSKSDLENAYQEDFVNSQLNLKKKLNRSYFEYYCEYINFATNDENIINNVTNVANAYINQINNATSITELDPIFLAGYQQMTAITYVIDYSKLETYRQLAINNVNNNYTYLTNNLITIPEIISNDYNDTIAILSSGNGFSLYLNNVQFVYRLKEAVVNQLKLEKEDDITTKYNYLQYYVVDEEIDNVDLDYQTYINNLNLSFSVFGLKDLKNDYYTNSLTYTIDELKPSKTNKINLLQTDLNYLSLKATPASIIAMQASFADSVILINSSSSEIDIEMNYHYSYGNILSDLELDSTLDTLAVNKQVAVDRLLEYVTFAMQYTNSYLDDYQLYVVLEQDIVLILPSVYEDEVTTKSNNCYNEITGLDINYNSILVENYRSEILANMASAYTIAPETQAIYDNYVLGVNTAITPIEIRNIKAQFDAWIISL